MRIYGYWDLGETKCWETRRNGWQSPTRALITEGEGSTIDWHTWVCWTPQGFHKTVLTVLPGRRIVELQTSQALINSPQENEWPKQRDGKPKRDEFGREPFLHPALNGLQGLTDEAEGTILSKIRLSQLAERYGLDKVTRWKPKRVCQRHVLSTCCVH